MYPTKKLGEIAKVINGRAYKQSELLEKGNTPVLRVGNLFTSSNWYYSNLNLDKDKYIDKGDLIYSWSASFGPFIWSGEKVIYHYHIWKIICFDLIIKDYLYWFLYYVTDALKKGGNGVGMIHITKGMIENLDVLFPPLPIQKLIVQKLDSSFEKIDQSIELTRKNLQNIEELNKSVLEKVFREGEYEIKNFGDIVINLDGKRRPVKSSDRKTEHGTYPYYGASGIIDYVDGYTHEGENLLISEDGANLVARKYPIAFIANGKYWVNNHAHIVKSIEGISDNHYLKYFFANKDISYYVTGSAQPKFNQKNLNSIEIPLPPLEKQKEIVAYLDDIFAKNKALKESYEKKLKDLLEMKQTLLKEAFEGRLVKE